MGETHKISPKSTDPIHLYSLFSYLQNVNTVLLDSRLGPTLSCLVAEKKVKFPNHNFSIKTKKIYYLPSLILYPPPSISSTFSFSNVACAFLNSTFLGSTYLILRRVKGIFVVVLHFNKGFIFHRIKSMFFLKKKSVFLNTSLKKLIF